MCKTKQNNGIQISWEMLEKILELFYIMWLIVPNLFFDGKTGLWKAVRSGSLNLSLAADTTAKELDDLTKSSISLGHLSLSVK